MSNIFALIFIFILVSLPALSIAESAVVQGSFEIINLDDDEELSWTSNLRIDLSSTSATKTLYFTADRGYSNIYTANFVVGGNAQTFTCEGESIFQDHDIPAYMNFNVYGSNIIGPSFITPTFPIQNTFIDTFVTGTTYSVYTFVSVIVDTSSNPNYVYLAGWSNQVQDAFVVARSTVTLSTSQPIANLTQADVLNVQGTSNCYDQYDERRQPELVLYNGNLIVLISGPCSRFIKITLPTSPESFSNAQQASFDPKQSNPDSYVSAASLDKDTGLIYYTYKVFNAPSAFVYLYNAITWGSSSLLIQTLEGDMARDSELLTVIANSTQKSLLIVGSGSSFIDKFTIISNGSLGVKTSTPLPEDLNSISTVLYYDPHLYFTTYEPDAKIVRIHMDNFCSSWCSENGYCASGTCNCYANYQPDSATGCAAVPMVTAPQSAVIGLGIVFALAIILAIIGWVMYWRTRSYTAIK